MAFLFLCIYLFFVLIRPQEWALPQLIPLRPVLITQVMTISLTVFELLVSRLKIPARDQPWWVLISGLFFTITISNIANFHFIDAYDAFIDFGKIYITFILIWTNLNTVKRLEIFSIFLVVLSAFIALHCILLHETGQGFGHAQANQRNIVGDSQQASVSQAAFYGIFGDPNDASQLFVIALPFCIFIILRYKSILLRGFFVLQLITLMLGVYATESRGGYIAMAIAIFVALRIFLPMRWFILFGAFGSFLILAFQPARFSGDIIDASSSSRVDYWGQATNAFKSNPLFGVGYQRLPHYLERNKAVHNSFVQAYAEIGVLGYIFWFTALAFTIFSMMRLSKAIAENNQDKSLILWMKCIAPGIIGGSVAGFFLSRAYILPNYIIMAMTAACYQLLSNRIGAIETNRYCYMGPEHSFIWIGLSLANMLVVYTSIIVLNIIK